MRYTVVMKESGPVYRLSRFFSISCLCFSLFLLWGLSFSLAEGVPLTSMIHIVLLLLASLAAAIYRDSWVFDTREGTITSWWGFGPFVKRSSYRFDEVERLELTHFVKGGAGAGRASSSAGGEGPWWSFRSSLSKGGALHPNHG